MKRTIWAIFAIAALLVASVAAWAQINPIPSAESPAPGLNSPPLPAPLILESKTIALGEAFSDLPAAKDRIFRMRKIELAPGMSLPMQSYAERPAIIYIAQGVVLERRIGQEQPIERETGDSVLATAEITNSWQNASSRPVTMLIAEILPPNTEQ